MFGLSRLGKHSTAHCTFYKEVGIGKSASAFLRESGVCFRLITHELVGCTALAAVATSRDESAQAAILHHIHPDSYEEGTRDVWAHMEQMQEHGLILNRAIIFTPRRPEESTPKYQWAVDLLQAFELVEQCEDPKLLAYPAPGRAHSVAVELDFSREGSIRIDRRYY